MADMTPVSLTRLTERGLDFRAVMFPGNLCFNWTEDGHGVESFAFNVHTKMFGSLDQLEREVFKGFKGLEGIHYVYTLSEGTGGVGKLNGDPVYYLRYRTFWDGAPYERDLLDRRAPTPDAIDDVIAKMQRRGVHHDTRLDVISTMSHWGRFYKRGAVDSRYPHSCPRCLAPAFVGFNLIDCSGGCP